MPTGGALRSDRPLITRPLRRVGVKEKVDRLRKDIDETYMLTTRTIYTIEREHNKEQQMQQLFNFKMIQKDENLTEPPAAPAACPPEAP